MEADPAYKVCALKDSTCNGHIQWHHHVIYAGGQLNEKWAIVGICVSHHERVSPIRLGVVREGENGRLDHVVLNRATDDELRAVSKATNYIALRDKYNNEYGDKKKRRSY